ncbi:12885_t:CDS:1, partial [Entrophospora sp. SA101]
VAGICLACSGNNRKPNVVNSITNSPSLWTSITITKAGLKNDDELENQTPAI